MSVSKKAAEAVFQQNLRICTVAENNRSRPIKGKYKGVRLTKDGKTWEARIKFMRKMYHLGTYESEVEAAIAYNEAAKRFQGDFCIPNPVPTSLRTGEVQEVGE